jgi:hypothetical protein
MFKSGGTKFGAFSNTSSSGFGFEKTNQTSTAQTSKSVPSKGETNKVNANDYVPKRFGLKFDPPTISKPS